MSSSSRGQLAAAAMALLVLACSVWVAHGASGTPGPVFPFYDNCRRNASYSRWSLRMIKPVVSVDAANVRACFLVRVNTSAPCTDEVFSSKGQKVVSRCCNTHFAKVKFWVDGSCRTQFLASPMTVPANSSLNKVVSPSWDGRPANYTEVKYTQFGPVPQNVMNGTTFCLTLKKEGPCNVSTLLGITSPFNRPRKLLQVAMYDRKTDGYECCPSFTFSL